MGWQAIETAPMDGTNLLLRGHHWSQLHGWVESTFLGQFWRYLQGWETSAQAEARDAILTTWSPLPESPEVDPDAWNPIDDAPQEDGAQFLIWGNRQSSPVWEVLLAHRYNEEDRNELWVMDKESHRMVKADATHWAPIPKS
jgi:hypothetical protein